MRVATAIEPFVVLQHRLQPHRVGHAGGLQQFDAGLWMGVDDQPLLVRQRGLLAVEHGGDGTQCDVEGQRRGGDRTGLLVIPVLRLHQYLAQGGGVKQAGHLAVLADIELHRGQCRVGVTHDQRAQPGGHFQHLVGDAVVAIECQQLFVQAVQVASQLLHQPEHRRLGVAWRFQWEFGFGVGVPLAIGVDRIVGTVHCRQHHPAAGRRLRDHPAALQHDVELGLAGDHHPLHEQQLAGRVVDRPGQGLPQCHLVCNDRPHDRSRRPQAGPRFNRY